jgi:hypothetical protein
MTDTDTPAKHDGVAAAERSFQDLRDRLLSLSQQFAKGEERNWEKAERFFSLSKKVDQLREQMSIAMTEMESSRETEVDNVGDAQAMSSLPAARRKSKKDYPKYAVRSDVLIKTGLSRDRRTEYEHAIPKSEFDAIVRRLVELGSRKHFVAEDVLGKIQCPSYQGYLVVSLLKERGLLAVPRRGVYAVRRPKNFATESQSVWDSLAAA